MTPELPFIPKDMGDDSHSDSLSSEDGHIVLLITRTPGDSVLHQAFSPVELRMG